MQIPFYFDSACPWAYLGSCRVESYFREVHLATLVERGVGKRPELGKRKTANAVADLRHWAELIGAEFSPDARSLYRSDTRLALRAALVAKDAGRFRGFHYPAYRARWAEARDLSPEEVVGGLLEGAGLDVDRALERAQSDELVQRLERDTQEAIERGVFGVPTLFAGGEMFWGNDRFELVRYYAQKAR